MIRFRSQKFLFISAITGATVILGCGGGSASSSSGGGSGSVNNTQTITVSTGPAAAAPYNEPYINGGFTTVTVCVPGSTTNCQTIGGILVDTGSFGLRILSSALSVSLPQQTDSSNNPIVECFPFLDVVTWGPVQTADMTIAGEEAKSMPIQVIGSANFSTVPSGCTAYGPPAEDLSDLGVNGLLGVGAFAQDCGDACTTSGSMNPGLYYTCPSSGCVVTSESIANQVVNPVVLFAKDNNGVVIQFPQVSGAEVSVNGTLTFGIGTQSDNALGSATVYGIDPTTGNFTTTYGGVAYTDEGFLDTGSSGLFFLDSTTTGIPTCSDDPTWYCPASTMNLSAVNQGANGATGTVNFSIANADVLLANSSDGVAADLGGPIPGLFDWGLPFFFNRTVFVAIQGQSTSVGDGPYWAY